MIVFSHDDLIGDLALSYLPGALREADAVLGAVARGQDPLTVDQGPGTHLVNAGSPDLDVGSPRAKNTGVMGMLTAMVIIYMLRHLEGNLLGSEPLRIAIKADVLVNIDSP